MLNSESSKFDEIIHHRQDSCLHETPVSFFTILQIKKVSGDTQLGQSISLKFLFFPLFLIQVIRSPKKKEPSDTPKNVVKNKTIIGPWLG